MTGASIKPRIHPLSLLYWLLIIVIITGWGTDEEQYSSSSECNSRASSAGHGTDGGHARSRKLQQRTIENLIKPLTLEIPCGK